MAQQLINLGVVPNDKTGDAAVVAGKKINDNFTEVFASLATKAGVSTVNSIDNRVSNLELNGGNVDGGTY